MFGSSLVKSLSEYHIVDSLICHDTQTLHSSRVCDCLLSVLVEVASLHKLAMHAHFNKSRRLHARPLSHQC